MASPQRKSTPDRIGFILKLLFNVPVVGERNELVSYGVFSVKKIARIIWGGEGVNYQ